MRVFLTGATGFIGRHAVARLAAGGHEMAALVRPSSRRSVLETHGVRPVEADLTDEEALARAMRGCDAAIHLAAAYEMWAPDPRIFAEVNVKGTSAVVEASLRSGLGKLVVVSTVAVWGRPETRPFDETAPPGPVRFSEYARTKHAADRIALVAQERRGLPLVTVHPGTVLGPGDTKASGRSIRDLVEGRAPATVFDEVPFAWVHVRDVAEGLVLALEKEGNEGERYILAAETLTFGEIYRMLSEISGVPRPRLRLPGTLAMAASVLFTWWAGLRGRPPAWGLAYDQMRTMGHGVEAVGEKAVRELGLRYTPVRRALGEMVAAIRAGDVRTVPSD